MYLPAAPVSSSAYSSSIPYSAGSSDSLSSPVQPSIFFVLESVQVNVDEEGGEAGEAEPEVDGEEGAEDVEEQDGDVEEGDELAAEDIEADHEGNEGQADDAEGVEYVNTNGELVEEASEAQGSKEPVQADVVEDRPATIKRREGGRRTRR